MDTYVVIDKDTKKEIEVTFHGDCTLGSDPIILDHKVETEKIIDDYTIKVQFIEKMWFDPESNIASRDQFLTENAIRYNEALDSAYRQFEFIHPVYHIFRHSRLMNKLEFTNTIEIGITTKKDKIDTIIEEDFNKLNKRSNTVYTYSVSNGRSVLIKDDLT